jgi:glycerol-3-phosphate acyltransferase PlsY
MYTDCLHSREDPLEFGRDNKLRPLFNRFTGGKAISSSYLGLIPIFIMESSFAQLIALSIWLPMMLLSNRQSTLKLSIFSLF